MIPMSHSEVTMETKQTKAEIVQAYVKEHPKAKAKEIHEKTGVNLQYIYDLMYRMSKGKPKKRSPKKRAVRATKPSTSTDIQKEYMTLVYKNIEKEEEIEKLNIVIQYLEQRVMEYANRPSV